MFYKFRSNEPLDQIILGQVTLVQMILGHINYIWFQIIVY